MKADNLLMDLTILKDNYLLNHHKNVAKYASLISRILCPGLTNIIITAAKHHDLGKIGIRDEILLKPGKLNNEEWAVMREHPVVGAELVQKGNVGTGLNGELDVVVNAIKYHHERWDGKGYPYGLAGDDIPLAARIIAVADSYDAMTTDRPYRMAISVESALLELTRCQKNQFDPTVVNVFLGLMKTYGEFKVSNYQL